MEHGGWSFLNLIRHLECEGLFNLFATTSEEVIARAKKEADDYYLPQIDYLKNLLTQNNIAFNLEAAIGGVNMPDQ